MEGYDVSTPSVPTVTRLPPCRVCNEKASGLHYGVNTCEACKRFFCRIGRTNPKVKCLKDQKCEARPGGRSRCSHCRYEKCLQVGMSIQGRKMGRYTSIQRTQNTLEVQGLMDTKIEAVLGEIKATEFQDPDYGLTNMQLKCPAGANCGDMVSDLEATIEQVCEASKQYSLIWKPFHRDKDIWDREVEFCRNRSAEKLAYGYVEPFGHLVGLDPYKDLGVDTANERKAMLVISHHLENCIKKVIKFAKAIPGFKWLPLDDQANLVKYSRFEFWMTMSFTAINTKLNVAMTSNGQFFHREDMEYLYSKEYIAQLYTLAIRFESIRLTKEELAILQAIVMTFTDRSELTRPDLVTDIQNNLLACFEYLLKRNHGPCYLKFLMKTVDGLIALRTLTEQNYRLCLSMASEWPEIQRSPLLLELFTM